MPIIKHAQFNNKGALACASMSVCIESESDVNKTMEIFADLHSSGIYLSGEPVRCQVTFSNIHRFDPDSLDDKLEHVAWASVQIQCICQVASNVGPSRRESESSEMIQGTSLQPQKDAHTQEVFATKPKILFCDLTLERGESKIFQFEVNPIIFIDLQ